MGSESDHIRERTYKPTKLSQLNSRLTKPPEIPPPPPQTTVSVPFKWEEAPGKPRHCHTESEPGNNARTLELPPRLLFLESKVSNMDAPSPTTVLDGPYMGRAMSFTSSYRTPRGSWNSNFGSTRWSGFKKIYKEDYEGSFDFSGHCTTSTKPKVKITRAPRRGSFLNFSKARSHLWASIYESFKQVVPWRRRQ
ncbi:uncharacterized protein LOC133294370 [Gastrolobium bilobum]|uniref:uncharacterized protein LOC133294370 n=1 Tax=Gastrolobium bilobum TaxID=150636 RepID=UPI002AB1D2CB|nr:uncharacterized protein LOC133294370 [Gastrolobium bilobum]